jgi:hypothetical protein
VRGIVAQRSRGAIELLTRPATVGKAGNLVENIGRSHAWAGRRFI